MDSRDLGSLREEASTAAAMRGHRIRWMPPWHGESRSVQRGACLDCNAWINIITRPRPNEIEISGEAVALECAGVEHGRDEETQIPAAVIRTAEERGIPLDKLWRNNVLGCWMAEWNGMILGIEPDGHAHT